MSSRKPGRLAYGRGPAAAGCRPRLPTMWLTKPP